MSSYTMQLREYLEHFTQELPNVSTMETIEIGREKLFDFEYPFFDKDYKKIFETNFIKNFYMREIGFETEGLFKFRLDTWLQINMPYWNKVFQSELLEFNPLFNVDVKTSYTKKGDTIQNNNIDKTQNQKDKMTQADNKNITKNETNNLNEKGSYESAENSRTDKTETGNKENTQNEIGSTVVNGVKDVTTNNVVSENGKTVDNQKTKDKGHADTQSDTTGKKQDKDVNFVRNLESDTPDSRLQITTEDGNGVIEYASKIVENDVRNLKIIETKETVASRTNVDNDNTVDKTSNTENKTNADGTEKETNENNEQRKNDLENKENFDTKGNQTFDKNVNDLTSKNSDMVMNHKGNETTDTERNNAIDIVGNEKLTSNINNVVDYIEHKFGKTSNESFSKMVADYRSILLRVEKQIFDEMNELFMLVY